MAVSLPGEGGENHDSSYEWGAQKCLGLFRYHLMSDKR